MVAPLKPDPTSQTDQSLTMIKTLLKSKTVSTGLAMFAMFFGAGNVVFPLALGQYAQDKNLYAVLGLLLSAIIVPFMGLIAMILFNGDYQAFFQRIGKIPGFCAALFIMCLIGPFGAIPRCIALSYSTITMFTDAISLPLFSLVSCLIIFLFTIKPSTLIDALGFYLTPFLLISLGIIIVVGIASAPPLIHNDLSGSAVFIHGLREGYHTMDLLGAFFFSTVVLYSLQSNLQPKDKSDYKKIIQLSLKAAGIGAFLLGIIYIGFSYVAALNSGFLDGVSKDLLLGTIAYHTLGPFAGIVTSIAVALACLTTAIALTSVFAEFLQKDIVQNKGSYTVYLLITLVLTFFVSTLNFTGIAQILTPILSICYPALIALTLCNILYKCYGLQTVKVPFLAALLASLYFYF